MIESMEESIKFLLEHYGLIGLIIVGLGVFVVYQLRQHSTERSEWREQAQEQHTEIVHLNIKSNETIKDNTVAVQSIKTLVESIDKRIH